MTRLGPEKRPTNMVFQGYGLFPHMNVRQNIAYGLKIAKRSRSEIDQAVGEMLKLVQARRACGPRSITELSGGQQQRVALARALIMRPQVLLLDEPLAALDLKLRQAMQEELRRIHQEIGGTFVFVTHDQGEALALANRIAVMEAGVLVQQGDAGRNLRAPEDALRLDLHRRGERVRGGAAWRDGGVCRREASLLAGADGRVTVVVRPEDVRLGPQPVAADVSVEGTLEDMVYLGAYVRYRIALPGGQHLIASSADRAVRLALSVGSPVWCGWSQEDQRIIEE